MSHATRGVVGTIADAVTIGTLAVTAATLVTGASAAQAVLAAFVCALCVALLATVVVRHARDGRAVRTADAIPAFGQAMTALAEATHRRVHDGSNDAFVAELRTALLHLAAAYGAATGASCVVTVKVMTYAEAHDRWGPAAETVCRSAERNVPPGIDWVEDNTDFVEIAEDGRPFFLCNDLPRARIERNYRNSRFTDAVVLENAYPYRSTIVWPVRPLATRGERDVIGFVCVDSHKTNVFDAPRDLTFGATFAASLYSGMWLMRTGSTT